MSPLWSRARRVARILREVAHALRSIAARVAALEARSPDARSVVLGYDSDSAGDSVRVRVLSSCWGNPPVAGADVYFFGSGGYVSAARTGVDGRCRATVNGDGVVKCFATRFLDPTATTATPYRFADYAGTAVTPSSPAEAVVVVKPNSTNGTALAPSATFVDSPGGGSGARADLSVAAFNVPNSDNLTTAIGTGYTPNVGVTLDGHYGTGLALVPRRGAISGASIAAAGSGYSSFPAVTIAAGGAYATISGTVAAGSGVESWSIASPGSGLSRLSGLRFGVVSNRASGGASEATTGTILPSAAATVSGGSVSAVAAAFAGSALRPGNTVTANLGEIADRGYAASIAGTVSGGSISAVAVANHGFGYQVAPAVSTSGSGVVAVQVDPTAIGSLYCVKSADLYVAWSDHPEPVNACGSLTGAFGTAALGPAILGQRISLASQAARGDAIWQVYSSGGPLIGKHVGSGVAYTVSFQLLGGGGLASIQVSIAGGSLSAVAVLDPGYGYSDGILQAVTSGFYGLVLTSGGVAGSILFAADARGSITGATIQAAGSGYRTNGSFLDTATVVGTLSVAYQVRKEYDLEVACNMDRMSSSDPYYPASGWTGVAGSGSIGTVLRSRVRASSYGYESPGGNFRADYDFSGWAQAAGVFQGGASKIVVFRG